MYFIETILMIWFLAPNTWKNKISVGFVRCNRLIDQKIEKFKIILFIKLRWICQHFQSSIFEKLEDEKKEIYIVVLKKNVMFLPIRISHTLYFLLLLLDELRNDGYQPFPDCLRQRMTVCMTSVNDRNRDEPPFHTRNTSCAVHLPLYLRSENKNQWQK